MPVRSFGTAQEIANAVAFLSGDESKWINGAVLSVDGGMSACWNNIRRVTNDTMLDCIILTVRDEIVWDRKMVCSNELKGGRMLLWKESILLGRDFAYFINYKHFV